MRVCIKYQTGDSVVKYPLGMDEQALVQDALERFKLPTEEWENYQLILVSLKTRVTKSDDLETGDQLLLQPQLSNRLFKNEMRSDSIDEDEEEKSAQISSIPMQRSEDSQHDENYEESQGSSFQMSSSEEEDQNLSDLFDDEEVSIASERSEVFFESDDDDSQKVNISLDEIKLEKYSSREDLKKNIIEWCTKKKFKLSFKTHERTKNDGSKVSTLYCSSQKKYNCSFYIQFNKGGETSTQENSNFYVLTKYNNEHNHSLDQYDPAIAFTPQILNKLKELMSVSHDCGVLTSAINKEFKTNFQRRTIYYQVKKIRQENVGKHSDDATNLIKQLKEEYEKKGGFYKADILNNQLNSVCFLSNRMKHLLKYFSDVLIMDVTHKINRFNLPCLDVALINNLGKTYICFFFSS